MGKVPVTFTAADTMRLLPGDCLLYSSGGPLPWVIKLKTWSPVSHVEVYRGACESFAARAPGVDTFRFRSEGLYEILRPNGSPLDLTAAIAWFDQPFDPKTETGVTGQLYDAWGLTRFFRFPWTEPSLDKQFCSELATRLYRLCRTASGALFCPFATRYDADLVSPGMFRASDEFALLWSADAGWEAGWP